MTVITRVDALNLGHVASRVAFWLRVFSTFAIRAAYVLGALWGAGNETVPMAAGVAQPGSGRRDQIRGVFIRADWRNSKQCLKPLIAIRPSVRQASHSCPKKKAPSAG